MIVLYVIVSLPAGAVASVVPIFHIVQLLPRNRALLLQQRSIFVDVTIWWLSYCQIEHSVQYTESNVLGSKYVPCILLIVEKNISYSRLSCSSLRFIIVFIFSSIYPWNSIWSPSLESAASSTWGSSYWCRPHAPLASSEQPNFLSICATVMTPLISNSPAAMEAHLWCMQWQPLISSVGAAESLRGLAKWAG